MLEEEEQQQQLLLLLLDIQDRLGSKRLRLVPLDSCSHDAVNVP